MSRNEGGKEREHERTEHEADDKKENMKKNTKGNNITWLEEEECKEQKT